jgi:2,3-bisphosphoglycerate-dependent phosphoglycerate mutase
MTIGFRVDLLWYEVGNSDFLNSFFSTIKYHLCTDHVSDRYPHFQKELYQGEVKWENALETVSEVENIRSELKKFKPEEVVWDFKDLSKSAPWGDQISEDITDLSNYFVTSDGEDLFDSLIHALKNSYKEKEDLKIVNL